MKFFFLLFNTFRLYSSRRWQMSCITGLHGSPACSSPEVSSYLLLQCSCTLRVWVRACMVELNRNTIWLWNSAEIYNSRLEEDKVCVRGGGGQGSVIWIWLSASVVRQNFQLVQTKLGVCRWQQLPEFVISPMIFTVNVFRRNRLRRTQVCVDPPTHTHLGHCMDAFVLETKCFRRITG